MRKTKPLELPCQLQSQPQQQPQSQAWQHVPAICPDYCLLLRLSLARTSQPLQLALSSSSVSLMMPINLLSLLLQSIHRSKKEFEPPLHSFYKDLLSVRNPVRKIQEIEISRVLRFEGWGREQHTEFRASIDLRWGTRREDACTPMMISCSCCSHRRRCLQVLIPASCSSCKVQLPTGSLPLMLALRTTKQKRNNHSAELTNAIYNEKGMMAYLPSVGKQREDGETARRSAMALKQQKLRVEACLPLSRFLQAAPAPSFCWSLLLV